MRPDLYSLLKQLNAIGGMGEIGQSGFCLLMALWQRANELNWTDQFTMTNAELLYKAGFNTEKTLIEKRNRLSQLGYFTYIAPKNRKQCGTYLMNYNLLDRFSCSEVSSNYSTEVSRKVSSEVNNPLSCSQVSRNVNSEVNSGVNSEVNSGVCSEVNINKLNQLNKTKPTAAASYESELVRVEETFRELTGKLMPSPLDVQNMRLALELTQGNAQMVIELIRNAVKTYKPKYAGDQIRAFGYFIPAIREAAALAKAKAEPLSSHEHHELTQAEQEQSRNLTQEILKALPADLLSELEIGVEENG